MSSSFWIQKAGVASRGAVFLCALGAWILVSLVGVPHLAGQGATATILGTITDPTGAAIPAAAIEVKNTGTGATLNVQSDAQGRYRVPDLGVGAYEVRASKDGFQSVDHKGITLTVGNQSVVDFRLPVGTAQQTVTVEGEVSQVETTNASVGALVDQQQMRELPLNGRNFEQLIMLAPGVQTVTSFTPSSFQGRANEYSVAGSRPEGQAILLDDENLQNFWNKGMGSITGSSLGVEAIGEFQTLTDTFSAQFGGNGAVVNAVSKSGTNDFHGSAYDFLRNSDLDSRGFFDPGTGPPPFRRNQFGGSIGGPIRKDKVFFFVNYEGIRQLLGETKIADVPDANARNGYLPCSVATAFACNSATGLAYVGIASNVASTMNIFPAATQSIGKGIGTITEVNNQTANENYVLSRVDYTISAKDTIFARYISDKAGLLEPFGGGGFGGGNLPFWPEQDASHLQFATVEERRIISPTIVNLVRVSFSRPYNDAFTTQSTPPLQFFPGAGRQDGAVAISGLSGIGGGSSLPFTLIMNRFTEGDDLLWNLGAHSIRFGANIERLDSNTYYPVTGAGSWTFQSLLQFMEGQAFQFRGAPNVPTVYPHRDFREIDFTPYFQDDWKATSKLTLNLGLRWEFGSNPVEDHNQLYMITNFNTATGYTHVPHVFVSNPNWKNLDPRFGFAYDPFADHKTSIRGGFGLFHDPIQPATYVGGYWSAQPWLLELQSNPTYPTPFTSNAPAVLNAASGFSYDTNTTPYMIQYSLTVQREVMKDTVVSVGYIGSHGVHLLSQIDQNPPTPTIDQNGVYHFAQVTQNPATGALALTTNPLLNSHLSYFTDFSPIASSIYNSMQATATRRFSQNFQAQVGYTLSKCLDYGSYWGSFNTNSAATVENPFDISADRGPCNFDITQALRFNGLYALPFHGNRFIEGWQMTGILTVSTGLPFNISDGIDQVGLQGGDTPRPNYIAGCNVNVGNVNEWFNPACFAPEAPGTLGNLGRDTGRGPGFTTFDFALLKDTRLNERLRLQFRAEFFNIFNNVNFALPAAALYATGATPYTPTTVSTAGRITSIVGTARQIQFALKLVF